MQVPDPTFRIGQRVRVIKSARHQTLHEGWIRRIVWHAKDQRHDYYLAVPGVDVARRDLSTRYREEDLAPC